MDVQRAQEIVASKQTIPVTSEGVSVWIDKVDATSGTAKVHEESNRANEKTVPVEQLMEQH